LVGYYNQNMPIENGNGDVGGAFVSRVKLFDTSGGSIGGSCECFFQLCSSSTMIIAIRNRSTPARME
jgi:hypothetical protein